MDRDGNCLPHNLFIQAARQQNLTGSTTCPRPVKRVAAAAVHFSRRVQQKRLGRKLFHLFQLERICHPECLPDAHARRDAIRFFVPVQLSHVEAGLAYDLGDPRRRLIHKNPYFQYVGRERWR